MFSNKIMAPQARKGRQSDYSAELGSLAKPFNTGTKQPGVSVKPLNTGPKPSHSGGYRGSRPQARQFKPKVETISKSKTASPASIGFNIYPLGGQEEVGRNFGK